MNLTKSIVASVLTAVVVLGVAIGFYHPTSTQTLVKGAPDLSNSQTLNVNGVTEWYFSAPMKTATSTVCSFLAPTGSSTIALASWRVTGNPNLATLEMDISTSTQYAGTTTSPLSANVTLPALSTGGWGWTNQGFISGLVNSTNVPTYVNFVYATTTATTLALTGSCQVEFTSY